MKEVQDGDGRCSRAVFAASRTSRCMSWWLLRLEASAPSVEDRFRISPSEQRILTKLATSPSILPQISLFHDAVVPTMRSVASTTCQPCAALSPPPRLPSLCASSPSTRLPVHSDVLPMSMHRASPARRRFSGLRSIPLDALLDSATLHGLVHCCGLARTLDDVSAPVD